MRSAAIVVLALTGTAAAQGTSIQGKLVAAELAEQNGQDSKDPAAFEVCGQLYVEVANDARIERPDDVPEALYNAGVCFEAGNSVSVALMLYTQIEREFPRHALVPRATARRAQIYLRLAMYDEAAAALETYAATWAGEADAYRALSDAVWLRAALGDDAAVRKDIARWVKTYGARRPEDAARAELMLAWRTRERGTTADALDAFRTWIKRYGGKAERGQLVSAYVAIGELAWSASCKVRGTPAGGLCLAPSRTASAPRCGKAPLVAVARDATLAAEATKAFQTAVRAAEASGDEVALIVVARARLHLVDVTLEAALAQELPAAAGQKELMTWMSGWQTHLGQASRGYEQLVRDRNLRVAVLAAGRIASLSQHAADTLASAPLPAWPKARRAALRSAYCDALNDVAAPLHERAKEAATTCLKVAGDVGVADETAACVAVFDRHVPAAAGAGERLPPAAWPHVRDVEPEVRYTPPGVRPSPP